jgi:hypothetical protein
MFHDDLLHPLANVTHRSNLVRLSNWLNPPSDLAIKQPRDRHGTADHCAADHCAADHCAADRPVVVDGSKDNSSHGVMQRTQSPLHQRVVQPLGGLPYFNWLDQQAGAGVQGPCRRRRKAFKSLPFHR